MALKSISKMIILRQKEFGNKANKAAQRKWKIEQAKKDEKLVKLAKEHSKGGLTFENSNQSGPTFIIASNGRGGREYPTFRGSEPFKLGEDEQLLRELRRKTHSDDYHHKSDPDLVKNIDQSINYKGEGKYGVYRFTGKGGTPEQRMQFDIKNNKSYKRNLKLNKTKRDAKEFIKKNSDAVKIGAAIGGAAVLTGAGALLAHRYNKRKKKQEEESKK